MRIFTAILVLVLIYGCSSSSSNRRYNPDRSSGKNEKSGTRYGSTEKKDDSGSVTFSNPGNEFDEAPPTGDFPANKDEFIEHFGNLSPRNGELNAREKLIYEIIYWLETPYKYGGTNLGGIDCSAFTQNAYRKSHRILLPRSAAQQYDIGRDVFSQDDLTFGDLVFFDTQRIAYPGHVGIYLGNNLFAHASVTYGVTISDIKRRYWQERYVGAKRLAIFPK